MLHTLSERRTGDAADARSQTSKLAENAAASVSSS